MTTSNEPNKPPIVGRERVILERLTNEAHKALRKWNETTKPINTRRGRTFQVRVLDEHDEPTGHIVTVTIELDRLEVNR